MDVRAGAARGVQTHPRPLKMARFLPSPLAQEDVALWTSVLELREAVNLVLEKARGARAIGASLDARVTLAVSDPSLRAQLAKLNAAANGVDELRYLFIVSQVCGARGGLGGVGEERRAHLWK